MLSNHCRPVVKYFIHQHITFSGQFFSRQLWRSLSTFSRTFMWQASALNAVPEWLASTPAGWKSTLMDPRGMANSIHKRPGSFTVQSQKTFLWWEARSRESWAFERVQEAGLPIVHDLSVIYIIEVDLDTKHPILCSQNKYYAINRMRTKVTYSLLLCDFRVWRLIEW